MLCTYCIHSNDTHKAANHITRIGSHYTIKSKTTYSETLINVGKRFLQHYANGCDENSQAMYPLERFKKKIKCRFGDELFVCCLHRQQLDSWFQRTSQHLKGGVQGRRESQKWFSHAHHNSLVFINPYCTSPLHLKQTLASTL